MQCSVISLLTRVINIRGEVFWNMFPPLGTTPPPILKHLISLTNIEPERAKDENKNHL